MAMAEIRVLHTLQVSPPPSVPSQAPQPLSVLDSIWLSVPPVERLFFYDFPHPTSHFIDNHLPTFVTSLSLTLRYFHPLAGTIRRSPSSDDRFEIIYTEGDSVSVIIAEFIGGQFNYISGHHPRNFNKLRLLVPRPPEPLTDGQSPPPLSVQVTLFPNQGLCIGFAVNHAACDGSGTMHFIRSWASAFRSPEAIPDMVVPLLDRSGIIDDHVVRLKMIERALKSPEIFNEHSMKQFAVESLSSSLVFATFMLGKDQIGRLKRLVQGRAVEEGSPLLHISSFVLTSAYVLRCFVKARRYSDEHDTLFVYSVNWRLRAKPLVPINYFGNCLGLRMTEVLKAGKIAGKDGVEVAAMAIGRSITGLQGKGIGDVLEESIDIFSEMVRIKSRPFAVSGSPKLGVYRTDFGWGRPVKAEVISIEEGGGMALAESREEEGGVEIGLVLPEEEMREFGKNFEDGLLNI